jgi:hypothetical protein
MSERTCGYTKDDRGEKLCAAPAEYEVVEPGMADLDEHVVDACAAHAASLRAELARDPAGYVIRSRA